jgi:hypothetical protein
MRVDGRRVATKIIVAIRNYAEAINEEAYIIYIYLYIYVVLHVRMCTDVSFTRTSKL